MRPLWRRSVHEFAPMLFKDKTPNSIPDLQFKPATVKKKT
jgi:hypothetical protein